MKKAKLERLWKQGPNWCLVAMGPIGFRLGYVCIDDKDHPWYGRDFQDIGVNVHGGLTFAGRVNPERLENDHDGIPQPDDWWIGFDCGHYMDAPDPTVWASATEGLDLAWPVYGDHVWTTDEVAVECARLALQVQVAGVMATAP